MTVKLRMGFWHEMLGGVLCVSDVCVFSGFGLIKLDLKTKSESGLVSSQWISVIDKAWNIDVISVQGWIFHSGHFRNQNDLFRFFRKKYLN